MEVIYYKFKLFLNTFKTKNRLRYCKRFYSFIAYNKTFLLENKLYCALFSPKIAVHDVSDRTVVAHGGKVGIVYE